VVYLFLGRQILVELCVGVLGVVGEFTNLVQALLHRRLELSLGGGQLCALLLE
jgi:hypothetical protein